MPEWVALGRRKNDTALMFDIHAKREVVRADISRIVGEPLEEMVPSLNKAFIGIVLINREWSKHYFVIERPEWEKDDYFRFAEKRFKELNIQNP